jgi:hypothetical protein
LSSQLRDFILPAIIFVLVVLVIRILILVRFLGLPFNLGPPPLLKILRMSRRNH